MKELKAHARMLGAMNTAIILASIPHQAKLDRSLFVRLDTEKFGIVEDNHR